MCHILLLMPLLALPVFWLLPESQAIGAYSALLAISGGVYLVVARAMHLPVLTGPQALIGRTGKVVALDGRLIYVRINNETWTASAPHADIAAGEAVTVVAVDGLTLEVDKAAASPRPANGMPGAGCCTGGAATGASTPPG